MAVHTRVSRFMRDPEDVANESLAMLSFEQLRKLRATVVLVGMKIGLTRPKAESAWRKRVASLTLRRAWRVPAGVHLPPLHVRWLAAEGVRAEMECSVRRVATRFSAATVYEINGHTALTVSACGEFWTAPPGAALNLDIKVPALDDPRFFAYEQPLLVPEVIFAADGSVDLLERPLHRVGGPAVRSPGLEVWARNGLPHRADGPAVVLQTDAGQQVELWFFRGQFARGGEAEMRALAAAAATTADDDPAFSDAANANTTMLPPGMEPGPQWRAVLAEAAAGPLPLPPPPPALSEPPIAPGKVLEDARQSTVMVGALRFLLPSSRAFGRINLPQPELLGAALLDAAFLAYLAAPVQVADYLKPWNADWVKFGVDSSAENLLCWRRFLPAGISGYIRCADFFDATDGNYRPLHAIVPDVDGEGQVVATLWHE